MSALLIIGIVGFVAGVLVYGVVKVKPVPRSESPLRPTERHLRQEVDMNKRLVDEIHDAARDRALRNLNPHAAALAAMTLYSERYAAQSGGSMDFWSTLTDGEKQTCADIARRIREARPYKRTRV